MRRLIGASIRQTSRGSQSLHVNLRARNVGSLQQSSPMMGAWPRLPLARHFASQTTADEKIEEIQDLYATAKDEFEIAAEETEKMTVYAEDDRLAAREELEKLQEAYKQVINGQDVQLAEEVKRRVGQRIRELSNAVEAMEEIAKGQD